MEEAYIKSIKYIKKYEVKNLKEYMRLAKKYNLLNNISLEYISGKDFLELLEEINKVA